MRVLLIAPPGAGKGTQGKMIAEHFGLPHIATGDLLRDHVARGTELGREVEQHLANGDLVPDEVVLAMVGEAVQKARDNDTGFVIDGIPRTMEQARALYTIAHDLGMRAGVALHLDVPDDVVTERMLARAATEGRADDTPAVVARRLALYHEVTAPILTWYEERGILVTIDATPPVAEVSAAVLAALDRVAAAEAQDERPEAAEVSAGS